jgi:hypothetical protein
MQTRQPADKINATGLDANVGLGSGCQAGLPVLMEYFVGEVATI